MLSWPFLPGAPALILGSGVSILPYSWLSEKVKSRGQEIDRLLPVAVGRITAGLLAGGSIPEVLQKAGESLEVEAPNPLTPELFLTAAELRSKDRQQAFHNLAARSPSTSLANLAYLLDSYSEAGGGKYTEVLMQISQRIQQILVARNRSIAKAGDALALCPHHPGRAAGGVPVPDPRPTDPSIPAGPARAGRDFGWDWDDGRWIPADALDRFGGGMTSLVYLIGLASPSGWSLCGSSSCPACPPGKLLATCVKATNRRVPVCRVGEGGYPN